MYMVMRVIEDATVVVSGRDVKLPLELMDGMSGAVPVFDSLKDAEAAARDGKYKILEVEAK